MGTAGFVEEVELQAGEPQGHHPQSSALPSPASTDKTQTPNPHRHHPGIPPWQQDCQAQHNTLLIFGKGHCWELTLRCTSQPTLFL